MKATHLLIGGGLLLAAVVGLSAYQAAKTGANLEITLFPKIEKLNLQGVQISVDAQIVNKEKGSLVLNNPSVELRYKDELIREVKFDGQAITIPPGSTLKLSDPGQLGTPIVIQIPMSHLIKFIPDAIAAVTGFGDPVRLDVWTKAKVKAPNLPEVAYTVKEYLTLQSPV